MANESNAYLELRITAENGLPIQVDFGDKGFALFRDAVCNVSYGSKGDWLGENAFEMCGRWRIDNNFDEFRYQVETMVNELNDALSVQNIKAAKLLIDFCDMDINLDTCSLGCIEINIQDEINNFNLFKTRKSLNTHSITQYAQNKLAIELSEESEDEDNSELYEVADEVFEALKKEASIRNRTRYAFTDDFLKDELSNQNETEILLDESAEDLDDLSISRLFKDAFIFNHIIPKDELALKYFELHKSELRTQMFHPEYGWDFPLFHLIKVVLARHGLYAPNKKTPVENVGKIILSLYDYASMFEKNYRNETILFSLMEFPIFSDDRLLVDEVVSDEFIEEYSKLVNYFIALKINPCLKNLANQSFYDVLCRDPKHFYKIIYAIEESDYFSRNEQRHKIFFRHRLALPKHIQRISDNSDNLEKQAKAILDAGVVDISVSNEFNYVNFAAFTNEHRLMDIYLQKPYDLNHCTAQANESNTDIDASICDSISNKNALMFAAINNDLAMARKLLHNGADPNFISADFKTPLYYATLVQNIEMIQLLMDLGGNYQYNELRHNQGLSDTFVDSASIQDSFNTNFWNFAMDHQLVKDYGDEYGNKLLYFLLKQDFDHTIFNNDLLEDYLEKKPWLCYTEIPSEKLIDEFREILKEDVSKVISFLTKKKCNFNIKQKYTKGMKITVKLSYQKEQYDDEEYELPLLIRYYRDTVKDFESSEVDQFITIYNNFYNLGYDVNTTDNKVSNIGDFKSVGNKNLLLTLLGDIRKLKRDKREHAYRLVKCLIENGSNQNSLDKRGKSVLDYLYELRSDLSASTLIRELLINGAKTGSNQYRECGIPVFQKSCRPIADTDAQYLLSETQLAQPLKLDKREFRTQESTYQLYTPEKLSDDQTAIIVMLSEHKDHEVLDKIKAGFDVSYRFDKNANILLTAIMFDNSLTALHLIENGFPLLEVTTNELTGVAIFGGNIQSNLDALKMAELIQNMEVIEKIKIKLRN